MTSGATAATDGGRMAVRRRLPGGLILRTATEADIEPLVAFNALIHGGDAFGVATWDELGGDHPTLRLDLQLVVEDPTTGAIVSAAYLVPMTWRLGSIELAVGQVEAVGTDPAYRRRGLSRAIIEGLHGLAAARGHLLTGIVGVRYLYRTFGYEYAIPFDGYRELPRGALGPESGPGDDRPTVRPARPDDAEALATLRRTWTDGLDLVQVVDADRFRWDIAGHRVGSIWEAGFTVVVSEADRPIAYARWPTEPDDAWVAVAEAIIGPDAVPDAMTIARTLARGVLAAADARMAAERVGVRWWLGAEHPVYDAFGDDLGPLDPPYAWYIRIPDVPALLRAMAPALEARLAASPLAGFDGVLTIDRWVETVRITFEGGQVLDIGTSPPRETDGERGDLTVPPLLLAQLVLGYRTIQELRAVFPDVGYKAPSLELIGVLFPRLRAWMPVLG